MSGPRSTVQCKTEGCVKFVQARGMCSACWKRWRNANPHITSVRDTPKEVLRALPATTDELVARLELSRSRVKEVITQLRQADKLHVGAWREPLNKQGSQWAPIYHKGKADDAPLDRSATSERSYQRSLVRNRANHEKRMKARGKRAAPFAAFLAPLMHL